MIRYRFIYLAILATILGTGTMAAQQVIYNQAKLFEDDINRVFFVDSSRIVALGGFSDMHLKVIDLDRPGNSKLLVDYETDRVLYNATHQVFAAIPYLDYEKEVNVVNIEGEVISELPNQQFGAFSGDGSVFYGVSPYNKARAFNWQQETIVDSLDMQESISSLYSLPGSRALIHTTEDNHTLWIWSVGEEPLKVYETEFELQQVVSSDEFIVLAERLKSIDYRNHEVRITILSYEGQILQQWEEKEDAQNLVIHSESTYLAGINHLDEVLLWEREDGMFSPVEEDLDNLEAKGLRFSDDGSLLIAVDSFETQFFSLRNYAVEQSVQFAQYDNTFSGSSDESPAGNHYAVAFRDEDFKGGLMVIQYSGEQEETVPEISKTTQTKAAVILQSGHQHKITSLAFAENDRVLFSGDENGTLIKWDLKSGLHYEPLRLFGQDEIYGSYSGENALGLAYNSFHNHLAVTADNSTFLPILDAGTMNQILKIPNNTIPSHPSYSDDGNLLAYAEGSAVNLYSVDSDEYKLLKVFQIDASINDLVFSKDSSILAVAAVTGEVHLFDIQTGKVVQIVKGYDGGVIDLEISPNGQWLYSVDFSSNIRKLNLSTFEEGPFYKSTYSGGSFMEMVNDTLRMHLQVRDIQFSSDGEYLYSIGEQYDNTEDLQAIYSIRIWNTGTGEYAGHFEIDEATSIINVLEGSESGKLLATGGWDQTVRLWDTDLSRVQTTFGNPIPTIQDAAPYFEQFIVLSTWSESEDFQRLQQWNIPELKIEHSLDGVQYGTDMLVLDRGREKLSTNFAGYHRWISFNSLKDSTLFIPPKYYSHMHATPEGGFLFGYEINTPDGYSSSNPLKDITIDVYDSQTERKVYTIETRGVLNFVDGYTGLIPRFDTRRKLFALQTGHEEVTLYNYHTGKQERVITAGQRIENFQFGDDYLYLWHAMEIVKADPENGQVTPVTNLPDPVYDPERKLVAASGDMLAWTSETREVIQVGRTKSFKVQIYDRKEGKILEAPISEIPQELFFIDNEGKLVVVFNNILSMYSTENAGLLGSMVPVGEKEYFYYTPDFFYSSSRNAYPAVGFQFQNRMVSFDQLDLWYNRPDIVMNRLNMADQAEIDLVYEAYIKRLRQAGFSADSIPDLTTLPEIDIVEENIPRSTGQKTIQLSVEAVDTLHKLSSLHVYANGVPVHGQQGKEIKGQKVNEDIELNLLPGDNKIQVSARNRLGFESLRETVEIEYIPEQIEKGDLYLVSINVSDYLSDNDLKYARKDGQDFISLYSGKAADFYNTIHVDTLFDENATLERILALKDKLSKTGVEDRVIVFVSGHGLLDNDYDFYFATYDTDFSHPAERGISYDQIEWLLDGIPARRKLLLIDACHSGEVDKDNLIAQESEPLAQNVTRTFEGARGVGSLSSGGIGLENSFDLMQELFANLNRGSGTVVISAAAGDSFALESDQWRNGVFTFSLLDGLTNMHADSNKDGEVTVSELRTYIYEKVVEETGGRQKPTTRQENLEFDFRVW